MILICIMVKAGKTKRRKWTKIGGKYNNFDAIWGICNVRHWFREDGRPLLEKNRTKFNATPKSSPPIFSSSGYIPANVHHNVTGISSMSSIGCIVSEHPIVTSGIQMAQFKCAHRKPSLDKSSETTIAVIKRRIKEKYKRNKRIKKVKKHHFYKKMLKHLIRNVDNKYTKLLKPNEKILQ